MYFQHASDFARADEQAALTATNAAAESKLADEELDPRGTPAEGATGQAELLRAASDHLQPSDERGGSVAQLLEGQPAEREKEQDKETLLCVVSCVCHCRRGLGRGEVLLGKRNLKRHFFVVDV